MALSPEQLLSLQIGGATVADNLRRAVSAGHLIEDSDGGLRLPPDRRAVNNWAWIEHGPPLGCTFLMKFLFRQAYASGAVPLGCSTCYKVKVLPRTMRELVATWGVAKRIACRSKWGIDLQNSYSQNIYAGYFYTSGLETARLIYRIARDAFAGDPRIGTDIGLSIKRGCSEYETALGPSDTYQFAPELAELEAYLRTRYRAARKQDGLPAVPLAHWIDTAFRTGDDTYLDFTGGQRLRPKAVSYDPQ